MSFSNGYENGMLINRVAEYIDYYNNYSSLKKSGYLSPTEFEQDYKNKKNA